MSTSISGVPLGINPPDLREQPSTDGLWSLVADATTLDADGRDEFARRLHAADGVEQCLVLQTCHRVELYGRDPSRLSPMAAPSGVHLLVGSDVVRHLFRVAAGLESAVVGEDQILSQLREATRLLRSAPIHDPIVDRLAQSALGLGRRVRRGGHPREHGLATRALAWLSSRVSGPSRAQLLVVGAGQMGRSIAIAARRRGWDVRVATRTPRRLVDGLDAIDLASGALIAREADAIAVALPVVWGAITAVPADALPPLVDLSSPSAIPASVRDGLVAGFLGIDGLFEEPDVSRGSWPDGSFAIRAAEEVTQAEQAFLTWLAARPSAAAARTLSERAARRLDARVERTLHRLPDLDERSRTLVRELASQVAADLLHEPLAHLRADADGSARAAAHQLFDL